MKKLFSILLLVSRLIVCLSSCDLLNNINGITSSNNETSKENAQKYEHAFELIEGGDYAAAYEIFCELGDYKDSQDQVKKFHYMPTKLVFEKIYTRKGVRKYEINFSLNDKNLPSQGIVSDDKETVIWDCTYDENGNLIKEVHTYSDGDKYIRDYTYDEKGNLIKKVYTYSYGDKSIDDYTYDEKGNLIKEVHTDYIGDKSIDDYTYDENGNLIKEVHTYSDGDKYIYDYTYDENGNLIKEVHTYSDSDKEIYDYTYDEKGNLIKKVYTDSDGDKEIAGITYKFVYIPFEFSVEEFLEGMLDF